MTVTATSDRQECSIVYVHSRADTSLLSQSVPHGVSRYPLRAGYARIPYCPPTRAHSLPTPATWTARSRKPMPPCTSSLPRTAPACTGSRKMLAATTEPSTAFVLARRAVRPPGERATCQIAATRWHGRRVTHPGGGHDDVGARCTEWRRRCSLSPSSALSSAQPPP